MLEPFENLPEDARIWIYQSDSPLSDAIAAEIEAKLHAFIQQWEAHGAPLHASGQIFHNRFLVIGVDEHVNQVTGCSTDASVSFVRLIGEQYGIDFFNRMQLPLVVNDAVEFISFENFKKKNFTEPVTAETLTFDNLIQKKGQLETAWMKPVGDTWLAKYL